VVTTGGIVGKIAGTEKDFVLVEIAPNVKVKIEPSHVAKRLGGDSKAEAA
jgi:preprotein translocase subunit YajC